MSTRPQAGKRGWFEPAVRGLLAGALAAAASACGGAQTPGAGAQRAGGARYPVRVARGWHAGARGRLASEYDRRARTVAREGGHVVREQDERSVVRIAADHEVLAVRDGGRVAAERYTVAEFSVTTNDGAIARPLAAGTRLESDCRDPALDCVLRVDGVLAQQDLYDALDPVIGLRQSEGDRRSPFDSESPRRVGERWPIDHDVAVDLLTGWNFAPPSRDRVRGFTTLTGVRRIDAVECLELDGEVDITDVRAPQLSPEAEALGGAVRYRFHGRMPASEHAAPYDSESRLELTYAMAMTRPTDHARLRIDSEYRVQRRIEYRSAPGASAETTAPAPVAPAARPHVHTRALPRGSAVSTNFRFALRATPGWSLTAGEAAQRMVPGVAAVASDARDGRAGGFVRVQPTRETDLERLASQVMPLTRLETPREIARDRVRVADTDAVRVRREGRLSGAAVRTVEVVLLHDGFAYSIAAWATPTSEVRPDALVDAFELLPGPVTDAWPYADTVEARGPGWRIHARRFESAASGLRVTPGPRWQFVPDAALALIRGSAEVGLVSLRPRVYVLIDTDHALPAAHARYVAGAAARHPGAATAGQPAGATVPFVLAGAPLPLSRAVTDEGVVLHGLRCADTTCAQVVVTYPLVDEAEAQALLAADMPEASWLAAADRAALARELAATPAPVRDAGEGFTLRDGRFTLPSAGVSVVLPPSGTWRVHTGAAARAEGDAVSLSAVDRARGVALILLRTSLDGPVSGAAFHAMARQIAQLPANARVTPVRLGSTTGYVSDGDGTSSLGPMRMHLVTATRGGEGFRLALVGPADNMAAATDLLAEVARGFTVAPESAAAPAERGLQGDRWVDDHFGFAVRVPAEWQHAEQTAEHPASDAARVESWSQGNALVSVIAMHAENSPADTFGALVSAPDGFLPGLARTTDAREVTFGGRPARVFTWRGMRWYGVTVFAQIDHVAYVINATDPQSVDAALATAERVELLP